QAGPVLVGSPPPQSGAALPAVAFTASGYRIVWSQLATNDADLYTATVSPDPTPTISIPVALFPLRAGDQVHPVVLQSGTSTYVAWADRGPPSQLYGTLLGTGFAFPLSTGFGDRAEPAGVSQGTSSAMLVWTDGR